MKGCEIESLVVESLRKKAPLTQIRKKDLIQFHKLACAIKVYAIFFRTLRLHSGRLLVREGKPTMADCAMKKGTRDWSQLPLDLLALIASMANDISDYICFGAVCKSWKYAVKKSVLHRQRPWILIQYQSDNSTSHAFYDPWNDECYNFNMCLKRKRIRASYYGWLFMEDNEGGPYKYFLLNPITRNLIHLPRIKGYVATPMMTANPYSENCLVIFTSWAKDGALWIIKLHYCRPGDNEWNVLDMEFGHHDGSFLDSGYSAYANGKAYIWSCMKGKIASCDIGHEEKGTMIPSLEIPDPADTYNVFGTPYGDLLLVTRKTYGTGFRVLKANLHEPQPKWSEVLSIGDAVLFLSRTHSSYVLTSDFPSLKKNHVYYVGPVSFLVPRNGSYSMEILDIATNHVEELPCFMRKDSRISWDRIQDMHWFTPSLS